MSAGDYSVYAFQVENLILPPEISAFEKYGIPVQMSVKIQHRLSLGEGLELPCTKREGARRLAYQHQFSDEGQMVRTE